MVPLRIIGQADARAVRSGPAQTPPMVDPDPEMRVLLDRLRQVARRCRASARVDLFEACAALSADPDAPDMAHAEVLMKGLAQVLGKTPVFFRPGEREISFDEAWLLRLMDALARDDDASLLFLLGARVRPSDRRAVTYLVLSVSERFAR